MSAFNILVDEYTDKELFVQTLLEAAGASVKQSDTFFDFVLEEGFTTWNLARGTNVIVRDNLLFSSIYQIISKYRLPRKLLVIYFRDNSNFRDNSKKIIIQI